MTNTYIKKDISTFFNSPGTALLPLFNFSNEGRGGISVLNSALYVTLTVIYSDTVGQTGLQTFDACFRCASGVVSQSGSTFSTVDLFGGANTANISYSFDITGTQLSFRATYGTGSPSATFYDLVMEGFLVT